MVASLLCGPTPCAAERGTGTLQVDDAGPAAVPPSALPNGDVEVGQPAVLRKDPALGGPLTSRRSHAQVRMHDHTEDEDHTTRLAVGAVGAFVNLRDRDRPPRNATAESLGAGSDLRVGKISGYKLTDIDVMDLKDNVEFAFENVPSIQKAVADGTFGMQNVGDLVQDKVMPGVKDANMAVLNAVANIMKTNWEMGLARADACDKFMVTMAQLDEWASSDKLCGVRERCTSEIIQNRKKQWWERSGSYIYQNRFETLPDAVPAYGDFSGLEAPGGVPAALRELTAAIRTFTDAVRTITKRWKNTNGEAAARSCHDYMGDFAKIIGREFKAVVNLWIDPEDGGIQGFDVPAGHSAMICVEPLEIAAAFRRLMTLGSSWIPPFGYSLTQILEKTKHLPLSNA